MVHGSIAEAIKAADVVTSDDAGVGGWLIYALIDPRDGRVRYVGKTRTPWARLCGHSSKRGNKNVGRPVCRWLLELNKAGHRPFMFKLEVTQDWDVAERRWIADAHRSGCDLMNVRKRSVSAMLAP